MTYKTWTFDRCTVMEEDYNGVLHCFIIKMVRDGKTRTLKIRPKNHDKMEEYILALDHLENGEVEE